MAHIVLEVKKSGCRSALIFAVHLLWQAFEETYHPGGVWTISIFSEVKL